MTPFIITEDGNIDMFEGGKMDAIYQADDQYLDFFETQVRELQAKKSQGIITSVEKSWETNWILEIINPKLSIK